MKKLTFNDKELVQLIKEGEIGILPTDTIYGIHASAFNKVAIEKMYEIRLRDKNKPFIILISDISDIEKFGCNLNESQRKIFKKLSNQSVSFVLPVLDKTFEYLTRNKQSIAFRIPSHKALKSLLKIVGPLVSTSVNKQGERPAETIGEATGVFGNLLDFAVDEGRKTGEPSTVVKFTNDKLEVVRQGKTVISSEYLL